MNAVNIVPPKGGLQSQIQDWLHAHTKIGAAMVIDKAGLVSQAHSGVRIISGNAPIKEGDKFHIGSITKPFTSALIGRYIDEGTLRLSDRIMDLAPDWNGQIQSEWHDVTLAELLSHTAGTPANINYWQHKTREAAILSTFAKKSPYRRGNFRYSNFGFMTVGALLEAKLTAPWEKLIKRELLDPIGIKSAGFGAPIGAAPLGHQKRLFRTPRPVLNDGSMIADNAPILGPAGTLHMNARDLTRFGRAILNAHFGRKSPISPRSATRMLTPRIKMQRHIHYGLGWMLINQPNVPQILYHNGSNTMWLAALALIPEHDLVMAYVSNDGRQMNMREDELLEFANSC